MAVTLRDVADRAGVSVRTVSNVVNDFRHVSPQMRAKVQVALDELGYQPNLLARSLRQGRTGVVGLLVPELAAPYFGELAHLVIEAARPLGLTVLVDETGGAAAHERDALTLLAGSGRVDGVLFSALGLNGSSLRELAPTVPIVLLGEQTAASAFDHVGIDNVRAASDAVDHLVSRGCRRIVAIGGDRRRRSPTSVLRQRGWREACRRHGLPHPVAWVAAADAFSRTAGYQAMQRLLPERPDGVFCFNDTLAVGALRAASDAGLSVPGDIAIIGFDDTDETHFTVPRLSSVRPDVAAVTSCALELLEERQHYDGAARDVVVGHEVVARESTARATAD